MECQHVTFLNINDSLLFARLVRVKNFNKKKKFPHTVEKLCKYTTYLYRIIWAHIFILNYIYLSINK